MKKKGFTLLELLIVILIIAIIATMAYPYYMNYIERSRASEAIRVLGAMRMEAFRYRLEHGHFPGTLSDLDIDVPASGYWTYDFNNLDLAFTVVAQRTALDAPPDAVGDEIIMYDDTQQNIVWCGDHVGVPRW